MESLFLTIIGVGALVLGGGMVGPARNPDGERRAIGGLILVMIGIIVVIGGVWAAGMLVGSGG